jgi:hypothetical protein
MNALRKSIIWLVLAAIALAACKPESPSAQKAGAPPIDPSTLTAWSFYDGHDPQQPEIILAEGDSYALKSDWQVQSIEYIYKWWGLGEPIFDHQLIERKGDQFYNGAEAVDGSLVQSFLQSIAQLYPTQMLVGGNAWTDDYPTWSIELVGSEGQHLLLWSNSTGNRGSGPWNVVYNSRLYAQYDGSLGEPLGKLFRSRAGEPAASFFPGGREPGTVVFSTEGWPAQMIYGFDGLLPIADGFHYGVNVISGTLEGYIEGRSSIGGYGHIVIGTVTGLKEVQLTLPDQSRLACKIDPIKTTDPSGAVWKFSCAPGNVKQGEAYRYGITIGLSTDQGSEFITRGELFGRWDKKPDGLLVPASFEAQQALSANEVARDLLSDHALAMTLYAASIDPSGPLSGTLTGEAVFVGQSKLNDQIIRYTIGTPFTIQNGQLTQWNLGRSVLDKFLDDVTSQSLTQRVLKAMPNTTINLWYAEEGQTAQVPAMIGGGPARYAVDVAACGSIQARTLPQTNEPLRAFGFNSSWAFYQADFVLVDGKSVVNDLDLFPNRDDREGVLPLLIPDELNTGDQLSFDRIWLSSGFMNSGQMRLTLWIPDGASAADRATYDRLAASLPVAVDKQYNTLWEATGLTFAVTDDGKLKATACE